MKILLLVLTILSFSSIYSQNKIELNAGSGYYLSNSENSSKIMGDKKFSSYLFYGFSYQRKNILGLNFEFEYNYHKIIKENTIVFVFPVCDICESVSSGGDVNLINHTFDLSFVGEFADVFFYGIGPSFIITNRIIEVEGIWPEYKSPILYDKLASSGLGLNGFLDIQIPFTKDENYFYFTSKLKLRYTYAIWFDEGIRKLEDYYQEFLTTQLSIGVGYSF